MPAKIQRLVQPRAYELLQVMKEYKAYSVCRMELQSKSIAGKMPFIDVRKVKSEAIYELCMMKKQ